MPTARTPQAPTTPWTDAAPTGSSILILSKEGTARQTRTPPRKPTRTAHQSVMTSGPAVMATRPASRPLAAMEVSGLPLTDPGVPAGGDRTCATGERRGERCDTDGRTVSHEHRAGVEAEPADEEDECTDDDEGDRVPRDRPRLAVGAVLAQAGAEDGCADRSGDAAGHVHDAGTGEVAVAELGEPATAPGPVDDDRVDERGQEHRVDRVRTEAHALRDGTGDDGRRRGGERHLEEEVDFLGDEVVAAGPEEPAVRADEPAGRARRRRRRSRRRRRR